MHLEFQFNPQVKTVHCTPKQHTQIAQIHVSIGSLYVGILVFKKY